MSGLLLSSNSKIAYINGMPIDEEALNRAYPAPDGVKRNSYYEILNRDICAGYTEGRGEAELIVLPKTRNGSINNILVTAQLYSRGGYTGRSHITTWIFTHNILKEPRVCFRSAGGQASYGTLLMNFQVSFNETQRTQAEKDKIALGRFYIGSHNSRYGTNSNQYYRNLKVWYNEN